MATGTTQLRLEPTVEGFRVMEGPYQIAMIHARENNGKNLTGIHSDPDCKDREGRPFISSLPVYEAKPRDDWQVRDVRGEITVGELEALIRILPESVNTISTGEVKGGRVLGRDGKECQVDVGTLE